MTSHTFADSVYLDVIAGTIAVFGALAFGLERTRRRLVSEGHTDLGQAARFAIGWLAAWLAAAVALAAADFYRTDPGQLPPRIAYGIGVPLLIGLAVLFSNNRIRQVLDRIPVHWIIGIQLYRALGVTFLVLLAQHQLPTAFALSAGSGDLLVGVTAPFVAWAAARKAAGWRGLAFAWNIVGILDLVAAITLGVGSTPGPLRFIHAEPSAAIMSHFPMVLIPTFAVPLSWLLHVLSLRTVTAPCRERIHRANPGSTIGPAEMSHA